MGGQTGEVKGRQGRPAKVSSRQQFRPLGLGACGQLWAEPVCEAPWIESLQDGVSERDPWQREVLGSHGGLSFRQPGSGKEFPTRYRKIRVECGLRYATSPNLFPSLSNENHYPESASPATCWEILAEDAF